METEQKKMYSQSSEESFILDFYKDKPNGRFLDIGAFHPTQFSNTRALYERGFSGLLVEPAPKNYIAIAEHYKDEPRIETLNVAVGSGTKKIKFYEAGSDAIGTTEILHRDKWAAAGVEYKEIEVDQIDTKEFMDLYAKGCDMISIDVEATNITLFRAIPDWVWQQTEFLVIEHDTHIEEIEAKLTPFGFKTLYTNAENILMGKS